MERFRSDFGHFDLIFNSLVDVTFSNRNFGLNTKRNRSDFGLCPNTKPSGIGPKVDPLKSEHVQILDIQCMATLILNYDNNEF